MVWAWRRSICVKKAAADFMIEATGVQKVYAAGGLRVRAPNNLIPVLSAIENIELPL
jgi:hypothetical protein